MVSGGTASALVAVLAVLAYFYVSTMQHFGKWTVVEPHNDTNCVRIHGPPGMEDIQLTRYGEALLSSDNRTWFKGLYETMRHMPPEQQSDIYSFDLRKPAENRRIVKLPIENLDLQAEPHRHYHGIFLRQGQQGQPDYLYVVVHSIKGEGIYVLRLVYDSRNSVKSLYLEGIIRDPAASNKGQIPLFKSLNDIIALPSTQSNKHVLYVTNYIGVGQDNHFMAQVELYLRRRWSYVIKCESYKGEKGVYDWTTLCSKAIVDVEQVNGIALTRNNEHVVIVESGGKRILFYRLHGEDVNPNPEFFFTSTAHHDNINLHAESGDLWIGSHPVGLQYAKHAASTGADLASPAPSVALRVPYNGGKYGEPLTEVLLNGNDSDGRHISASSTAFYHNGEVLISAVFQGGLTVCQHPTS